MKTYEVAVDAERMSKVLGLMAGAAGRDGVWAQMMVRVRGETMTFFAGDGEVFVKVDLPVRPLGDAGAWEVVLPPKMVKGFVGKEDGDEVRMLYYSGSGNVKVVSGSHVAEFQRVTDYEEEMWKAMARRMEGEPSIERPGNQVCRALEVGVRCAAREDARPVLRGVFIGDLECEWEQLPGEEKPPKSLYMAATDGYRLVVYDLDPAEGIGGQYVVPAKAARLVTKTWKVLLDEKERLGHEIGLGALEEGWFGFWLPGAMVMTSLLDGPYPSVARLFPLHGPTLLAWAPVEELTRVVKRALAFGEGALVDIDLEEANVMVLAVGYESAQAVFEVPIRGEVRGRARFGLNLRYLRDALAGWERPEIPIGVWDDVTPVLVGEERLWGWGDSTWLIMPLILDEAYVEVKNEGTQVQEVREAAA